MSDDTTHSPEPKRRKQMAEEVDYDWNAEARIIRLDEKIPHPVLKIKDDFLFLYKKGSESEEPVEGPEEVARYKLNHGDVLRLGDYRDANSSIICRDKKSGAFEKIPNPDDTAASYLTIPSKVLEEVTDAMTKFNKIIKDCTAINIHISHADKFLKDKLDGRVPEDWKFDLHFIDGKLEDFWVRAPDVDWNRFDTPGTTLEDMKVFFEGKRCEQKNFFVYVELKGDLLQKYKNKYGAERFAWVSAKPTVPRTWLVERGASSMGSDHSSWTWIMRGPATDSEDVKKTVSRHLRGFPHKMSEKRENLSDMDLITEDIK